MTALAAFAIGIIVCLGYNVLYFDAKLPNGESAQLLDILDYLSNNVMMPVIALATCILIGWVVKPETVTDEVMKSGARFRRKALYIIMIRFLAPVFVVIIMLTFFGII